MLREYTGRGPSKAKTVISSDMVVIQLQDTLTKGERSLVNAGNDDVVLRIRHDFQQTMREDLVALVQDAMGRKVLAFMSQNHIDPDMAVEVFVMEPEPEVADPSEHHSA